MKNPDNPQDGFEPYRFLTVPTKNSLSEGHSDSSNVGRPGLANRDLPLDIASLAVNITHLSLWVPPANFKDTNLELVVAVATAGGTVSVSGSFYSYFHNVISALISNGVFWHILFRK